MPKAYTAFGSGGKNHPWAASGFGRRWSRSLSQHSHPTRIVAGAGIDWRTSAHKRNPLFRRRAPALNTVDPKGLLILRAAESGRQGIRRPFVADRNQSDDRNARSAIHGKAAFSPRGRCRPCGGAHTTEEGIACWELQGRRDSEYLQDTLDLSRRLRGELRLILPDSTGSVPLQSG